MAQVMQALAASIEADWRALVELQGDACFWLDASGCIRREHGIWPRSAADSERVRESHVGKLLAEVLPASVAASLRALCACASQGSGLRWTADMGGSRREYELRAVALTGNRWLVTARELTVLADPILESECARLRSRVATLEMRLQRVQDERAMFAARLTEEVERAARRADPVSVVRLELHELAHYGQKFGDPASLEVLGTVDQALRRDARAGDLVARWNDSGFAMLLPNTDRSAARLVAERHQRGIGAIHWPHQDIGVRVGLATLWHDASDPDDLLQKSAPSH